MTTSKVQAQWKGKIKEGQGTMKITGYDGAYTFASRFEGGKGTNPEELIGGQPMPDAIQCIFRSC